MSKTINELYLEIAQRVVDVIDEDWKVATIDFQYLGNAGMYYGRYISGSDLEKDFKVGYKTYRMFKLIRSIMIENGSNQWNRAKLTLIPSGKFDMEFEWDQSLVLEG